MKILSIELKNFRNYTSQTISFKDGLNVLYGDNGAGKTNVIESVYLCSTLQSPIATKDKEMIKKGELKASIKMNLQKKFRSHSISIQIDAQNKKKVLIDGIPVQRAGELLGVLGVVFFSPNETKIVKESPQLRRHFLNTALSQRQKSYFVSLQKYNKILMQKNNLLKEYKTTTNVDEMLDIWDSSLAKEGAIIISKRIEYIKELNDASKKYHKILSDGKEDLSLEYETNVKIDYNDLTSLEKNILTEIKANRLKEKELGFATVGPHRDDLNIELNGDDARKYASTGQQRSITLSMKLGEVEIYQKEMGETPVVLLDDVLSELDEKRQNILMDLTTGTQTILTDTKYNLLHPATLIKVEHGTIVE